MIQDKAEFDQVKADLLDHTNENRISKEEAIAYYRKGFISEVEIFRFTEKAREFSGKDFYDLTTEELTASFAEAVKKAIEETHALGLPTTHGDGENIFRIYPDGRKEIIE